MTESLADLLDLDDKWDADVREFFDHLEKNESMDDEDFGDAEATDEGKWVSIEIGGQEWGLASDFDEAFKIAVARVEEEIEDDPSIFNTDFIQQFIDITPTDKRIIIGEAIDNRRTDLEDDEDLTEDEIEEQLDEIEAEWKDGLEDPLHWFVEELGWFTTAELMKQNWIGIDEKAAADQAVDIDGPGHFLSGYDGELVELDNLAVAWRMN